MSTRRYSLPSINRSKRGFSFSLRKKSMCDDDDHHLNHAASSSHNQPSALHMLNTSDVRIAHLKRLISSIHPGHCRQLPGHQNLYHIFGHRRVDRLATKIDVDEVYPNLYIGNEGSAKNKSYLKLIGITHVVNCAEGVHFCQTNTGIYFYQDVNIKYMGLNILDVPEAKISIHFQETADFIERALQSGGRVLVHCMVGLSRSATIAIAYLVIKRGMSLEEAIKVIRRNREIRPNDGFLKQLIELEYRMSTSGTNFSTNTSSPSGMAMSSFRVSNPSSASCTYNPNLGLYSSSMFQR